MSLKNMLLPLGFAIVSSLSCLAESPEYFLKYIKENPNAFYQSSSSFREAYAHLHGKDVSEDEWFEYFSENERKGIKIGSEAFDLRAKHDFLRYIWTADGLSEIECCEMMTEILRDIYSNYEGNSSHKFFSEVVAAEIRNYIKTRSDEDQERYRRLMFYRERAYYVWLNISVSLRTSFVEKLFRAYGKDYRKIIEFYERSLIWKEDDIPLSKFMRLYFPKDKKSIEAIEREEGKINGEHEIIEKNAQTKKNAIFIVKTGAALVFVAGTGVFLWLFRRRKKNLSKF